MYVYQETEVLSKKDCERLQSGSSFVQETGNPIQLEKSLRVPVITD